MLDVQTTSQFKKDVKRCQKRGKNLDKFKAVLKILVEGAALPIKYKDHALVGQYLNARECHLEPDWLLIYRIEQESVILLRLGSHAEVFE